MKHFIHCRAHNLSISTSSEPCLNLKVDIKPFSEAPDWDASSNSKEVSSLQQSIGVGQKYVQNMQNRLPGLIMNQVGLREQLQPIATQLTNPLIPDGENFLDGHQSP